MRITQGQFSFLPDLTDDEIRAQLRHAITQGWAVAVEHTDDPHPRNTYWQMWGPPMFHVHDAEVVMAEVEACRRAHSGHYVKVNAFDSTRGVESTVMSFIVQRPADEPGFELQRTEVGGRQLRYTSQGYAARRPAGQRYAGRA